MTNLTDRITASQELMAQIPEQNKSEAFKYQTQLYNSLPSCKLADDYFDCMKKKLSLVSERTLARYKV